MGYWLLDRFSPTCTVQAHLHFAFHGVSKQGMSLHDGFLDLPVEDQII